MKHTDGPWKVVMPYHAHAQATCRCVQIGRDDSYTTSEVLTADAHLIAAAPDFLAACTPERLDALDQVITQIVMIMAGGNLAVVKCEELLRDLRRASARATVGGEGEQVTP